LALRNTLPQILFIEASAALHKGEKVGLVGPNGAGKTTRRPRGRSGRCRANPAASENLETGSDFVVSWRYAGFPGVTGYGAGETAFSTRMRWRPAQLDNVRCVSAFRLNRGHAEPPDRKTKPLATTALLKRLFDS
jgi:hypothetical protein